MPELLRLKGWRGPAPCASPTRDTGGAGAVRRRFLRNGLLAGAGLLLGGATGVAAGETAARTASPRQDRRILRFLLQLEYLQAEFYAAARSRGRLRGELREYAEVVGAHEREHVALLERLLGGTALRKPAFDFGEATDDARGFASAARQLEEIGVAAYIGQGANLTGRPVAGVARIAGVEARHAAWIADFLGRNPAPLAADKALSANEVLAAVRRTGFLRS
jgi:Ferritin-like domain